MSPQLRLRLAGTTKSLGFAVPLSARWSPKRSPKGYIAAPIAAPASYSDYNAPVSYSGCYREDGVIISRLSGLHSADAQRLRNLSV
jgi:hypothetical protein